MLRLLHPLACFALVNAPSLAHACPNCIVGQAARARVWSDDFWLHLSVAILPFLFVLALSIWVERLGTKKP